MNRTVAQIFESRTPMDKLVALKGNSSININQIASYETGGQGTMVFAPTKKAIEKSIENGASLIVIPGKLDIGIDYDVKHRALITSSNIGVSHARLKQKYGDHEYTVSGCPNIHPSAVIHESVTVDKSCKIGPNVVIEHGAKIGKNVTIHPGTIIGWNCEIGNDCLILANSVIGGEGFGYAQDEHFNHHRIPQTGNVIIGNKVRIGALNTIDRGTYGPTKIGNGCIFDNMCHVAHNVIIGENCIILSGFLCAGSSVLGDRVVASGGTMIKDHVEICDNTYLVHRAGVIKNITQPGIYAGSPVLPMKKYVQSNAIYQELGALRKMVLELSEKLADKT